MLELTLWLLNHLLMRYTGSGANSTSNTNFPDFNAVAGLRYMVDNPE